MLKDDITHCRGRISVEERSARTAPTEEQRERHLQVAMLYRAQLAVLERRLRPALEAAA